MNYNESLKYTHSLLRFGIKPGLNRIYGLLDRLGNPQNSLKFIHVAGTNGKGSVSSMTAAALINAGYKTGLFTSPYISDFRERIQVNSQFIPCDDYAKTASDVKSACESFGKSEDDITEFEFITAVAMLYFARVKCDVVVLEVGLGGRFDATNVIKKPLVSVITSISLDHTAILGNTTAEIAAEKCGIIKQDGITVTCPGQDSDALTVIKKTASERNNLLIIPSEKNISKVDVTPHGNSFCYNGENYCTSLCGHYQIINAVTAVETLKSASQFFSITDENIKNGLKSAFIPARLETICTEPLVLLDGAHNPGGVTELKASLKELFGETLLCAAWGMLGDKNWKEAVDIILPCFKEVTVLKPDNPRALDPQILAGYIREKGICQKVTVADVDNKLPGLIKKATDGTPTVVFGSLYLAAPVREIFKGIIK